jgi:hypothetical protein
VITDAQLKALYYFKYSPEQRAAIFAQVDRACTHEFDYDHLVSAANSFLDDMFPGPAEKARDYEAVAEAVLNLRIAAVAATAVVMDDVLLDGLLRSIEPILDKIEHHARDREVFWREDWHPKVRFYWTVLDCWRATGGLLRRSRHSVTGRVGGPTVLYFEAAVAPVMEEAAPGREAIAKIIKQCEIRHRELDEADARGVCLPTW